LKGPARFSGVARREFAKALRETDHAVSAERLRDVVERSARRIGERPLLGRFEPALADARYRVWSRPDTAPPSIVRFVHTARDLPTLLANLRSDPNVVKD
jgi:hypothetical protein